MSNIRSLITNGPLRLEESDGGEISEESHANWTPSISIQRGMVENAKKSQCAGCLYRKIGSSDEGEK